MATELVIRNMTRAEVDELVGWEAREGWNPGVHDGSLCWAADPEAFVAAELGGVVIGGVNRNDQELFAFPDDLTARMATTRGRSGSSSGGRARGGSPRSTGHGANGIRKGR